MPVVTCFPMVLLIFLLFSSAIHGDQLRKPSGAVPWETELADRQAKLRLIAPGLGLESIRARVLDLIDTGGRGGQFSLGLCLIEAGDSLPAAKLLLEQFPRLTVGGRSAALLGAERAASVDLCPLLDSAGTTITTHPLVASLHAQGLIDALDRCECPSQQVGMKALFMSLWIPLGSDAETTVRLRQILDRLSSKERRHQALSFLLGVSDTRVAYEALAALEPGRDQQLRGQVASRAWPKTLDLFTGCEIYPVSPLNAAIDFLRKTRKNQHAPP